MSQTSFAQTLLSQYGTFENAIKDFQREITRNPVEARLNLQFCLNMLGREAEAFRCSEELLTIAPDDARILFNRGWHLLHRGQFREGFELLESGRYLSSYGDPKPVSSRPLFSRERKNDKCVLMVLEGGLGDQIISVRFAQHLHRHYGHGITIACHPGLASVFARMPAVHSVISREGISHTHHDCWLPGMSAPWLLADRYDQVGGEPYLTTAPEASARWQKIIQGFKTPGQLKVGIRWAGSPHFEHQQMRKFPASVLTDLHRLKGVKLFSFQRDNDLLDLPEDIVNLGPFLQTWEDTAAALSEMDLVISSCTSVAHMSAALGVKTWVIVPVLPYFIWTVPGQRSPWYNGVRLYRQQKFGEWEHVHRALRTDLAAFQTSDLNSSNLPGGKESTYLSAILNS